LSIKIAGAGVAGLTAALALARKGVSSDIHERRGEISDEGFGIQLSPNALRAFASIGVILKGVTPVSLKVYAPQLTTEMSMGEGFLCLSRASLVTQLLTYTLNEPLIRLHLNSEIDTCDIDASGVFSKFRADELGILWKETFISILDDLKVRKFRLSAHWPMIEPQKDNFDFQQSSDF
jgi:salicylate hydroxylase